MIGAITIIETALGAALLLPIGLFMLYLLLREWRQTTRAFAATRLMILVWCAYLEYLSVTRLWFWWRIAILDLDLEPNEINGLIVSTGLLICAVLSFGAFVERQRLGPRPRRGPEREG